MKFIEKAQEDRTTLILLSLVCFLVGLVLGFMLSPVKSGVRVTIGSNNVISNGEDGDDDDDE